MIFKERRIFWNKALSLAIAIKMRGRKAWI